MAFVGITIDFVIVSTGHRYGDCSTALKWTVYSKASVLSQWPHSILWSYEVAERSWPDSLSRALPGAYTMQLHFIVQGSHLPSNRACLAGQISNVASDEATTNRTYSTCIHALNAARTGVLGSLVSSGQKDLCVLAITYTSKRRSEFKF